MVCKECQHAVWPDKIQGHLSGKHHGMPRKQAQEIAEEVRGWPWLIPSAIDFGTPAWIDQPIPQLPLYDDGWMCQLDPENCRYICRDKKTLKNHWHEKHQYSIALGPGGSGSEKKLSAERRFESGARSVCCQRFFPTHHGSQYFEVRRPGAALQQQATAVAGDRLWNQVRDRAMERWAQMEKASRETIAEGQRDEANPWLDRTGWAKYLKQLSRSQLLASVREPGLDPDGEREPVEAEIWKAMGEVADVSQASATDQIQVGVFVRLEAIRTEPRQTGQTIHRPLRPYMDRESILGHVRPWQQALMFFARTQREHDWASPPYRFTRAQRRTWDRLIEEARQAAAEVEAESEAVEVDVDRATPTPLTGIQKACLDFCIELLNQTITRREYDSAFVCALAVLGVHDHGWKGPDLYPTLLSAIIKVARFMVVQKALEIVGPDDDDQFNDQRPCDFEDGTRENESESSNCNGGTMVPGRRREGCLQLITRMMNSFMVRGSQSPMQWMLDLRTYGMKIHFNTTATGHVGWQGSDEILYKDVQFNMAQFRGMVHGWVQECRQSMEDLLFCRGKEQQMPEVPWESLRDNPTNVQPGWNFLQDQRARMPVDGQKWLFDRIGDDAAIRRLFLRPDSQSGVNRDGVRAYLQRVAKFLEKLLLLMHVTGQLFPFPRRREGPF